MTERGFETVDDGFHIGVFADVGTGDDPRSGRNVLFFGHLCDIAT